MVFWSLCLFGAILAQKLNSFICEKKNLIFWHPWDPWGRIHIDLNKNSVQTGCVDLKRYIIPNNSPLFSLVLSQAETIITAVWPTISFQLKPWQNKNGQAFVEMLVFWILFCSRQLIEIQKRIKKRASLNKELALLVLTKLYKIGSKARVFQLSFFLQNFFFKFYI